VKLLLLPLMCISFSFSKGLASFLEHSFYNRQPHVLTNLIFYGK